MKHLSLFLLLTLVTINLVAQELPLSDKDEQAIRAVMAMQEDAWNVSDIDAFMESYWKSELLVFSGASGPTFGWQATKDGYLKRYPNSDAMGMLNFTLNRMQRMDKKSVLVLGEYHLTRTIGDANGYFTLWFRKHKGQWLIISDHTSAAQ